MRRVILEEHPDIAQEPGMRAPSPPPEEEHVSSPRPDETEYELESRRLPCSVESEEPEDVPLGDPKMDIIDGAKRSEAVAQRL
jgi:hypothetical protein